MKMTLSDYVKHFLQTLQTAKSADDLKPFYHPNIEQIEFPNILTKQKTVRNLNDLLDGFDKGRAILEKQSYELTKIFETENTVIIEAIWTGTLAIPLGKLKVGDQMTAWFAQIYEFSEGKIIRQRNYDCFKPF